MKMAIKSSSSYCIYCKKRLDNLDINYHSYCFENMNQYKDKFKGLFLPLMYEITNFPFSFTSRIKNQEYKILVHRIESEDEFFEWEYGMHEFDRFYGFPTINKNGKLMNYGHFDNHLYESLSNDSGNIGIIGNGTNIDWSKIPLDYITGLNLRKGFLRQIPEDIGRLERLTHLSIVHPEIRDVWEEIRSQGSEIHNIFEKLVYRIPNLERFETHWLPTDSHINNLDGLELPKSFEKLTNLQRLDIDVYGWKEFPDVLLQFPKLKEVHFYYLGQDIGWDKFHNPIDLKNFDNKEFFESVPKDFIKKVKRCYMIY
ncbi:MAG: hypothetical protein HeimC3_39940 [Candidatus Heimdallarchaeota archaeon LC_3]|nr:MAG: hypothetical protein HeimC3_39940 [Candidatus Heimdallarchaeota archaeon LC_3]